MLEISVEDVKRALELLLEKVQDQDGVLRVDKEGFWSIPQEGAYEIYEEPADLTIGMVSESWEQVEAMLREPDRVVGYGLVWLAEVLRAAGGEASA